MEKNGFGERVGAGELLHDKLTDLIVEGYLPEEWARKVEDLMSTDNSLINNQLVETASGYTYEYQYQALQSLITEHIKDNIKDDICTTQSKK